MHAYSLECIIKLFLGHFVLQDNSITIDCLSAPVISSSCAKYNSSTLEFCLDVFFKCTF